MPSPFPGMDPYLEDPGLCPDVHHELISVARELLNRQVRPRYHVRVEERVYISDENDPGRSVIVPDLRVREAPVAARKPAPASGDRAGISVAEPVVLTTLIDDEIHEPRLEVIDREEKRVVTVIEVLSPANKVEGSRGRACYHAKRREIMQSPSHLVELDLLRVGVSIHTRELLPRADYYVHISRQDRRPKGFVWPILLTQRLPVVPIPLKPEDQDAAIDLQNVLETAYDRAAYDLQVDYRSSPVPPISEEYQAWAGDLLRTKGFRPESKAT